jgi:hypothetical protein
MSEPKEVIEAIESTTADKIVKELVSKKKQESQLQQPGSTNPNPKKIEAECRKQIKLFIKTGVQHVDNGSSKISDTAYIAFVYDGIASQLNPGNNKNNILVKNVMNNLIDYTASSAVGRWMENNVKEESMPAASKRRDLLIDQMTRLNTKPVLDPFFERFISTFWPEADSIPYKRPPPKTIRKDTIIKTTLYPTLPTIRLNPGDNTEDTDGEKDNHTYGSKIMTLTEKVKGDQTDYDILGVEMFLNTLMTTGSNLSFVPVDLKMEEKYHIEEELSNVANIPEDDDE